jgi:hypothetical protein
MAVPSTFFHVMPVLLYIWLRCYTCLCPSSTPSSVYVLLRHLTVPAYLFSQQRFLYMIQYECCTHDSFFCTTVCFFCLWRLWRDTPNSRPSPYADLLTQRKHFIIFMLPLQGFILMALKILSVSADTTLLYHALSLSDYCSEHLWLV